MSRAVDVLDAARGVPWSWDSGRECDPNFVLRAEDRVLGTLRWLDGHGALAEGRIGDEAWTFERAGFWRPIVRIRTPDSGDRDIGLLAIDGRRGSLLLHRGVAYRWARPSFWSAEWAFFDAAGSELVAFDRQSRWLETSGGVRVLSGGCADLPVLVLLGWYLLVVAAQEEQESAGAAINLG